MNNKLTKAEFLKKLQTDSEFNSKYGRRDIFEGKAVLPPCHYGFQCWTRELTDDERLKWVINNVDWVRNSEDPRHEGQKYLYRGEPKIYGDSVPKRAISLMWNQRSVDTALGLPFNIASYGLLLEILAKTVNMVPEELIGNLGDCHLYTNQIDGIKEQLDREPFPLPKLTFGPIFLANLEHKDFDTAIREQVTFELENYQCHPAIKMPLSN